MPRVSWIESTAAAVTAVTQKALAAVTPSKQTSTRRADRPVRIDAQGRRVVTWPDDDLLELERPARAHEWIDRRRTKDWLLK